MGDEVSDLFLPEPAGPSLDVRYRQGIIVTFNQVTLENTVLVGGQVLSNLPLQGVGEVGLLVPGAVVGIMVVGGPTKTMYINGRVVKPNTADAANAVGLLNSLVAADSIATQETRTVFAFGDLTTVGPKVTVTVRGTGRLLVMLSCQMQQIDADPADGMGGIMSFEMTGANVVSASTNYLKLAPSWFWASTAVGVTNFTSQVTVCGQAVFDGLNTGETTLTAKYLSQVSGEACDFGRRSLVVIIL